MGKGNAPVFYDCCTVGADSISARGSGKRHLSGRRPLQFRRQLPPLHIRTECVRHGVNLGQLGGGGPDIAVGQGAGRCGAAPAAKLPDFVRKYVLCRGQRLIQRCLHTQIRQRRSQFLAGQAFLPRRRLPEPGQQAADRAAQAGGSSYFS